MRLIGNALNRSYFDELVHEADRPDLTGIMLAVAYVRDLGPLVEVARRRNVPVTLYALAEESGFPSIAVLRMFVSDSPTSWQLFLTRSHYHPKIAWFRGVGCYIGSANLTDGGRISNLECGVWFDQEDLCRENMEAQLASMFSVIHGRSVAAVKEDIGRFERVQKARSAVLRAEHDLRGLADQEFAHIPGQDSPHLVGNAPPQGGAARAKFIEEWNRGLTLLRKLGESTAKLPRPSWVQADVSAAIAFDQATEFFYTRAVRRDGRRRDEVVDELHLQNRADPEAAVRYVFKDWAAFDGNEGAWEWARWCNENPKRLRYCLSSPSLAILTAEIFAEVTWLTHAAREHARQIDNRTLGLAPGTELSISQRCTAYAHFLFAKRSAGGHSVSEVLQYVLWGDRTCPDAAQRVWEATQHAEWRLPHLGPSILGEMIGYARPDEYPPRNQRVVRTLVALGYEGLAIA